jgi:hypothetical protein
VATPGFKRSFEAAMLTVSRLRALVLHRAYSLKHLSNVDTINHDRRPGPHCYHRSTSLDIAMDEQGSDGGHSVRDGDAWHLRDEATCALIGQGCFRDRHMAHCGARPRWWPHHHSTRVLKFAPAIRMALCLQTNPAHRWRSSTRADRPTFYCAMQRQSTFKA